MARSLSDLADNLSERIHKIKFKLGHDNKNSKTYETKYKDCERYLHNTNNKDNLTL